MVKHDDKWGTVSGWHFGLKEKQVACKTLGFSGGLVAYHNPFSKVSRSTIPIWMEDISCVYYCY